ncbi:hypothetical protein [Salinarimonas sp.]|uniref:hypothetical protein n=1 Tax=Salinarimonas sp. TaxID=2766526 RepID=UPI0032D94CDD
MRCARLSITAVAGAALAVSLAGPATAQRQLEPPLDWEERIPWIDWSDAEPVVESLPPGITPLGRTPPNALPGESTDELQALIDEAHEESGDADEPQPIRPRRD